MATLKPRINLTLQQDRYDLLKRLSGLSSQSMSSIITELLDTVYPVLERVVIVLEAAKKAQESQKEGMRTAVAAAEVEMLPHLYDAVSQFDMFMDEAARATGADLSALKRSEQLMRQIMAKEAAPAGVGDGLPAPLPAGASPRICNTGVRSKKPNKIKGDKK